MRAHAQAGITLVETAVAGAVIAIGIGGLLFALGSFARFTAHQAGPVRRAATALADQTLRIAENTWKYGAPGSAPSGTTANTLTAARAGAAPTTVPVTIATSLSSVSATGAQITVTVRYTPDPGHPSDDGVISVTGHADVKAPAPGSQVTEPGAIPQPSGAP